jgi:predicted HicB family RNase H-like nuclease
MSRTVSARIPTELHEELREKCNKLGCSINDYVMESIKFAIIGSSEFDFDFDDEPDSKSA